MQFKREKLTTPVRSMADLQVIGYHVFSSGHIGCQRCGAPVIPADETAETLRQFLAPKLANGFPGAQIIGWNLPPARSFDRADIVEVVLEADPLGNQSNPDVLVCITCSIRKELLVHGTVKVKLPQ